MSFDYEPIYEFGSSTPVSYIRTHFEPDDVKFQATIRDLLDLPPEEDPLCDAIERAQERERVRRRAAERAQERERVRRRAAEIVAKFTKGNG